MAVEVVSRLECILWLRSFCGSLIVVFCSIYGPSSIGPCNTRGLIKLAHSHPAEGWPQGRMMPVRTPRKVSYSTLSGIWPWQLSRITCLRTYTYICTYVHVPSSILLFFCRLGDKHTTATEYPSHHHEGRFTTYRDQKNFSFCVYITFRAFMLSCLILNSIT